jgi:ABC-2 type transport system permease protein
LGQSLVELLVSDDLGDLLKPSTAADPAEARRQVEDDQVSAAVIIPAGFNASILPDASGKTGNVVAIEVYANPARPIGAGVVQSIVAGFLSQVETGQAGGQVTAEQLIQSGRADGLQAMQVAMETGTRLAQDLQASQLITLQLDQKAASEQPQSIDLMLFLAPGMAMLFLMYTVSLGGRSLLTERRDGTLARLLSTPTANGQVLIGKVVGVYFIGAVQMFILIGAGFLLFQLRWGDPMGVVVLVLAVVAGATGWGMLLASVARTPGQVSSIGMAMMLLFGLLGGSFFGRTLPGTLETISKITPNAWGQKGFTILARGGGLEDLWPTIAGLLVMAIILLTISIVIFQRKGILQK